MITISNQEMSRNFTQHYLQHGDDDFNIYEGEPEEDMVTTHEDAYFANGGEGMLFGTIDNEHLEAIIADAVVTVLHEDAAIQQRTRYMQHSEDLNREMSEEEYQRFMHEQYREKHRYTLFQLVLDEFHHYVPDMLEARKLFHEHMGIPMASKLMELEKKKLF